MQNEMSKFITLQVNKMFEQYSEKEEITKEDIELMKKKLNLFEEEAKKYKVEFTNEEKESIKSNAQKIVDRCKKDETDLTPENVKVSSGSRNFFKKKKFSLKTETKEKLLYSGMIVTGIAIVATALGIVSAVQKKQKEETEQQYAVVGEQLGNVANHAEESMESEIDEYLEKQEEQEKQPNQLSENKSFDVNSNNELVNRMSSFIVDALAKGIAVKDVMTEQEIATANENEVNFLTIEQLMDYYYVMNIEDIDPVDYARLNYSTKTVDTIANNYIACADVFNDDLLTIKNDTIIDYTQIIADKESANALQKMVNYVADYNSSSNKAEIRKEITNYIDSNYVGKYDKFYSVSTNEQTYRFMLSYDKLTDFKGIPDDVNIILNEDGMYSCERHKEGQKNKTERAQSYTDIKGIVRDKLQISRDNVNQDLSKVSDEEKKTGIDLEMEIKETVLSMQHSFIENPKFVIETKTTSSSTKKTSQAASPVKGDNGLPIAQSEFDKYNIDPSTPTAKQDYEQAVRDEYNEKAELSDTHVIKDSDGNVVVRGAEVDSSQYNQGYADGYYDGNNKKSSSPLSSSESYRAGYSEGYAKGRSDRNDIDNEYSFKKEEHFEDVKDEVVKETESDITYNDYTNDPHANENNASDSSSTNDSVEEETEFEPVEKPEVVEEYSTNNDSENYEETTYTMDEYNAPREVEVQTLTKQQKLIDEYSELKALLQSIDNTAETALNYKTK